MVTSRESIITSPGYYLDRSATGTGKSHADIKASGLVDSALIVVPTHKNATEVEEDMQAAGLDALKYPGRRTDGEEINCWNPAADTAEAFGLSPMLAVCPYCRDAAKCVKFGYRGQIAAVSDAKVAIATHQRGVYNGIDKLAAGRSYISIHEDSASVLCPDETVVLDDLKSAAVVVSLVLSDPKYLDWLGQSASKDDDGNWVPDEKLEERRNLIDEFVRHLADVIDSFVADSETVVKTRAAQSPKPIKKAIGVDNLLLRATCETEVKFTGASWRVLLAAASGQLHSIGWIVDTTPKTTQKILVANWRNIPSPDAVTLFQDATVEPDDLETYIGHRVVNVTPEGHVSLAKRVVQFPRDINRRTASNAFLAMLRGVMSQFPDAQRIGVITHRTLIPHLKQIGEPFALRIAKSTYFGSGDDRASNDWYGQCDLIIVAGTPRVPSLAIQRRLIQFGDYAPAGENPDWGDVRWRGHTESGREVIVTNRGYRHPLWKRAHRSLVRAALIQAVGRGRSLLETGCDVAIISTEECGFPLADLTADPITQAGLNVLSAISDLSLGKLPSEKLSLAYPYSISKATQAITSGMATNQAITSTSQIAQSIGLSEQRTRSILTNLESRSLVARIGDRGGWMLTVNGQTLVPTSVAGEPA